MSAVQTLSGQTAAVWGVGYYEFNGHTIPLSEVWRPGVGWVTSNLPGAPDGIMNAIYAYYDTGDHTWKMWAAGNTIDGHTLIYFWANTWQLRSSPTVGTQNHLYGVEGTDSSHAWAVGDYNDGTGTWALILRWDGTSWSNYAFSAPGMPSSLRAVAPISNNYVWTVGTYKTSPSGVLTARWVDGQGTCSCWSMIDAPSVSGALTNQLNGVAVVPGTSPAAGGSIWAAGLDLFANYPYPEYTLIENYTIPAGTRLP